jgi:hypothetical protein
VRQLYCPNHKSKQNRSVTSSLILPNPTSSNPAPEVPALRGPVQPLALTDDQMSAVMRAGQPLAASDRGAFLEAMPQALASLPGIGDGSVHRVIAQTQRQFYDSPILGPPIM